MVKILNRILDFFKKHPTLELIIPPLPFVVVVIFIVHNSIYNRDVELAKLRNEVALRDQTAEIQKGVYEKLSQERNSLKGLLDSKDGQVKSLLDQISKNHEDLLTANQLVIAWKKAYEGAAKASQSQTPVAPGSPERTRVDFEREFSVLGVKGYTLTNPPEAWVQVTQTRPLHLTLAITQDKSKAWHAYATSSDDNTSVDIHLASVNPYILEPRWYERLQVNTALAGGSGSGGFGVLAGVGISYRFQQFDAGPAAFIGISDRVDRYLGGTLSWRPFQR